VLGDSPYSCRPPPTQCGCRVDELSLGDVSDSQRRVSDRESLCELTGLGTVQDRSQDRRHLGPYFVSTKIRVVEFNAVRGVDAASVARNRDMELGRRRQYAQLPDLGRTEVRDDTPKSLHPSSVQPLGQAVQASRRTGHRPLVERPLKCVPRDQTAQLACPRHSAHRPQRLHDCHVTESCSRRH
jgi:hypothetical protein